MGRVKSVTKIFNKLVHKEVKNKLEILMTKHEDKYHPIDLMKHLFHGTCEADPKAIYQSEKGLEISYAKDGLNGAGIYFADNSKYSLDYKFKMPNGES